MSKLNKKTIDRIKRITTEREVVLSSIKEIVKSGNEDVLESLDVILERFEETDKKNKEYIAILRVKEMIGKLIDEILKAETIEEVRTIRNKLNYQIDKVKKVLVKKGENPRDIETFSEKVKDTKNWIAEYVRTIKRKTNVDIISLANQDNLSDEEKSNILKIVNSESKFNKRINKKIQETVPKIRIMKGNSFEFPAIDGLSDIFPNVKKPTKSSSTPQYFKEKYNIEQMATYEGNFFSRVGSFFKNIPAMVINRKKLKVMTYDYNVYCGAPAFRDAIREVYQETRIRNGLKGIFFGGRLAKREAELENTSYVGVLENIKNDDTLVEPQQYKKNYSI